MTTLSRLVGAGMTALATVAALGFTTPGTAAADDDIQVMFACAEQAVPSVTRNEILRRSETWLKARVPYSQSACHRNDYGSYRTDCSGFVSMAWGLRTSYTTFNIDQVSHEIPRADLLPGDILNSVRNPDHMGIFIRWEDDARTRPVIREQAGPNGSPTVERTWTAATASIYTPRRYNNVKEDVAAVTGELGDVDGDGRVDVVAKSDNGDLWLYPNTGNADDPYNGDHRRQIGVGWNVHNKILSADVNADGRSDLVARDTFGGLWVYPNTGNPDDPFNGDARYQVGVNWNQMTELTVADVDGDGRADLVAKDGANLLWLYPNTDDGDPFHGDRRKQIGEGWHEMNAITAGDADSDGRVDLISRDVYGGLWLYPNTGNADDPYHGDVRRHIGTSWQQMTGLLAGDVDTDGRTDLVARDGNGDLWLYSNTQNGDDPFNGTGRKHIGIKWNGLVDLT